MANQLKTCFGITSKTEDNEHIVMIDSDISAYYYPEFKDMLLQIQQDYELSDFYIIKTKNGVNAFTLDKMELELLFDLLAEYDLIDPEFTIFGYNRGYYVLRMNHDKKYMECLVSNNNSHKRSLAHYNFFINVMQYPMLYNNHFDDYKCISICAYKSHKHGNDIKL